MVVTPRPRTNRHPVNNVVYRTVDPFRSTRARGTVEAGVAELGQIPEGDWMRRTQDPVP
jgi:hypothetical protein